MLQFGQVRDEPSPCRNGVVRIEQSGYLRLVNRKWIQHRSLHGSRIHPGLIHSSVVRSWHSVWSVCTTAASRSARAVGIAVGSAVGTTAAGLASAAAVTTIGHAEQWSQTAATGAASREQNYDGESDETLHDRAFRDRECVNRDQSGLKIAVEGEPVVEGSLTRSRTAPVQGTQSGASEVSLARRGFSRASERKIRRIRKKGQDEKSRCRGVFRQKSDTRS